MSNSLQYFTEELRYETGKYHHVEKGNVYVVNFTPNSSTLLSAHKAVIDRLIVPFLVKATKHLGPAEYSLNVLGSASATGTAEHNYELGAQRAYNAALYAIRGFDEIKRHDAELAGMTIYPTAGTIGSEKSKPIAAHWGWATRDQIEKNQAFFRGAVFKFKADIQHPPNANIYFIREIYYFKFKKVSEEAPALIKKIEEWLSNPIIKGIVDIGFGKLIKPLLEALGAAGKAATHLITYTIPSKVDYCFEVKDYRDRHALYRYTGVEHKDSLGLSTLLSLISGLSALIKYLVTLAKGIASVQKIADALEKLPDELINKIAEQIEKIASKKYADLFRSLVDKLRNNSIQDFLAVPASPWSPFRFYDESPEHDVALLQGAAKRTSVDAGFHSAVHLDFGGHPPNSWTQYMAHAIIISDFSLTKGIFGFGSSTGSFILVQGPYYGDIAIGSGAVVTG